MLLKNLILYPVFEIPEQIRRRIGFSASTTALDTLVDVVARNGQDSIGTGEYQSALSDIVGFDGTKDGYETPLVNVSGDNQRVEQFSYNRRDTDIYNFIAVLVANPINETRSQETQYIVTGYTSKAEQTLSGLLPDDMVLYINDIYGLRATYGENVFGERVINPNSYHLIDNYVLSQALSASGYHESTVDVINVAKSADMLKQMDLSNNEEFTPDENTIFSPSQQTTANLMSNNLMRPESFVSAISNSYLSTISDDVELNGVESFFEGTSGVSIEGELRGKGVIRQFSNFKLIEAFRSALQRNTGHSADSWRSTHNARFTLGDLKAAVVNLDAVDTSIRNSLGDAMINSIAGETGDNTDDWVNTRGMATQGSLVSFDLSMQISSLMARSLISTVRIAYDNRMSDYQTPALVKIIPNSISSISDGQLPEALARQFQRDLEALFVRVSKHQQIRFNCILICVLGTVNRVEISIDGEPIEYYTYASFMSARLHSGNTTDLGYVGRLAKDTSRLMKGIDAGYNEYRRVENHGRMLSNVPLGSLATGAGSGLLDQFGNEMASSGSLLDTPISGSLLD